MTSFFDGLMVLYVQEKLVFQFAAQVACVLLMEF